MRSLAVALCILAAPALAAPAPKPHCISLEKLQASKGIGTASPLTRAQFHFLQGVSAVLPNTPAGLPPADNAILIRKDGGDAGYIIWTMGPLACGVMEATAGLLKLLAQIKAGSGSEGDDL
jgi:hypothetical protein